VNVRRSDDEDFLESTFLYKRLFRILWFGFIAVFLTVALFISSYINPTRASLRLVKPGKLGSEAAFSPQAPFTLNPFAKTGNDQTSRFIAS
jgi:hypothetical protein